MIIVKKRKKKGWSPTPADILVGINPTRISAGIGDHSCFHYYDPYHL